jgi:hypothetical protein
LQFAKPDFATGVGAAHATRQIGMPSLTFRIMPEQPSHAYTEPSSFERLLLLIATLIHHPGVGSPDPLESTKGHDAVQEILTKMEAIAHALQLEFPGYSVHTIRKDLKTLRQYGILERRKYQWGYYLGTGAMTPTELQVALQALATQATQLGDAPARRIYETLKRRLRGMNLEREGHLFYPVRSQLNRTIVQTDPDLMMQQGKLRHTLFHHVEALETAVIEGQLVELYRKQEPYGTMAVGAIQVYPLQLIYAEIAWYVLYEYGNNQHLEIERVDRFSDTFRVVSVAGRGLAQQRQRLQTAHQLLTQGWGLYLGTPTEQRLELAGQLNFVTVKVHFFPPVMAFILEGDRRHPRQQVRQGKKRGQPYVEYRIELPGRSLGEFERWLRRFMQHAKVIAPMELAERHRQSAISLVQRYEAEPIQ